MTPGDDGEDDLPPPEIETIRNLVGDETWKSFAHRGALVKLDGAGVQEHSVVVSTLAPILTHFDRLVRITQAHRSGLEVKRQGPITEVKGVGHLAALTPVPGSFAIPLRLDPPSDEMFADDKNELEAVVGLLTVDGTALDELLITLPERVGDELVRLLKEAESGRVGLAIVVLRDGDISAYVDVAADTAAQRAHSLERTQASDAGRQTLRGTLWRIDTKHNKMTIDAAGSDEDDPIVVTVSFDDSQLEDLKESLREYVEVETSITEIRRSYEQTPRTKERRLLAIRSWNPVADAEDAEEIEPG
jgi:hypothetical protein